MRIPLELIFTIALATNALLAEETPWKFTDVTAKVVDKNPPGIGRIFDYAMVDLNDDNYLDIVVNNHDHNKPAPIWLGTHTRRSCGRYSPR